MLHNSYERQEQESESERMDGLLLGSKGVNEKEDSIVDLRDLSGLVKRRCFASQL